MMSINLIAGGSVAADDILLIKTRDFALDQDHMRNASSVVQAISDLIPRHSFRGQFPSRRGPPSAKVVFSCP